MNSKNFPITEPIVRARVAIIHDQAEAEREISAKRLQDFLAERRRCYKIKESLLLSLMANLVFIATLIRLVLGSSDMDTVSKIGFTVCLLVVMAFPGWRLWRLFLKKE